MMHVRKRALAGARVIERFPLERKDGADSAAVNAEIKKGFDDFKVVWETFQKKNDDRIKELEKKGNVDVVTKDELGKINTALEEMKTNINAEIVKLKRPAFENKNKLLDTPEKVEYSKKFEDYIRTGYAEHKGTAENRALAELEAKAIWGGVEKKAMSVGSNPDGGFTARPELETAIDETLKEISPIRAMATIRTIGSESYEKLVNVHGTASGWVGETDARPQTQGPQLKELKFQVMELYAMPAATQKLLDDSFVNIDQWLADEVQTEFAQKEGIAFVTGDGVSKPHGFLGYTNVANASYVWGSVGYIASGASGAFASSNPADALIDLYHSLRPGYRANGSFAMNNATLAAARKLKDGLGNYIINVRFAEDGIIERIMGKPVLEVPDMPDPAANTYSIAFADFKRAYLIVDRAGIRVLRDPYTAKPYVLFYTTKRVGGGIQNFEAIKLMKFAVS